MQDVDTLLRAIERQEAAALQSLYDLFSRQVYSLAYGVLQNRETAEEVTQDVFLKVWHKVAQYEPGTNFRAWLLRLTRNLAIDRLRQDYRHKAHSWVWDMEELNLESPALPPDDDAHWVWQSLRALSDEQRQAIELAYLQGLTHEQIAQQLNLPLGTVKTRIRDGMKKLRLAWEEEQ
jgi:RNA polymerase sigma-70 factor (ECF subfamily)